jgi:hypothetical protein
VPSALTRTLDLVGHPEQAPAVPFRLPRLPSGARRLLIGGCILLGGWLLLAALASAAHAAATPLPVPDATGAVRETLSTVGTAAARQAIGHASPRPAPPPADSAARGSAAAAARPGDATSTHRAAPARPSAPPPAAPRSGRDAGAGAHQAGRQATSPLAGQPTSQLTGQLTGLLSAPDGSGGSAAGRSGRDSGIAPPAGLGAGLIAPPGQPRDGIATPFPAAPHLGGLGEFGSGSDIFGIIDLSRVTGLTGGTGRSGVADPGGLDRLGGQGGPGGLRGVPGIAGLSLLPAVTDAATGLVRQPVAALGPLGAVASLGTGSLGGALTDVLGMGPLGIITGSLQGVLGHLQRLTAQLLSDLGGALDPVARLVGPLPKIIVSGGLPVLLPGRVLVPLPGSSTAPATGPPSPVPWPWGTSTVPGGHATSAGSDCLQATDPPAAPGSPPPGADDGVSTVPVMCGVWPLPTHIPSVPATHLTGGPGPFPPGGPADPGSGAANRALPTSSQNDGTGDAPTCWQARITDMFVPAWTTAPPAVRTAADEPAFSPD